ncbi:MAG: hypothetical protein GY810_06430 [Aureispira sp.]|nr:hypothetical protein [Aureispira sp.]
MSELLDDGFAPVKNNWFSDKKQLVYSIAFVVIEVFIMSKIVGSTFEIRRYLGLSHNGLELLGLFVILFLMIVYNI